MVAGADNQPQYWDSKKEECHVKSAIEFACLEHENSWWGSLIVGAEPSCNYYDSHVMALKRQDLDELKVRMTEEMCDKLEDKEWDQWDVECVDAWIYQGLSKETYKTKKDCESNPDKTW